MSLAAPLPGATPGMSTTLTVAGMTFCVGTNSAIRPRRGSGMSAIATFGFSEKPAASWPVSALKTVVLPDPGNPTMPQSMSFVAPSLR